MPKKIIQSSAVKVATQQNLEPPPMPVTAQSASKVIANPAQQRITELFGKLEWDDAFNHKSERSR
jgi:hypothetical protein